MIQHKINIIADYILLSAICCCMLCACNYQKKEFQEKIEKLQSTAIDIQYKKMACWTSDSIWEISPWNKAKLKLVHYVDSAMCSTCYLQKAVHDELICRMEKLSNNEFYNVFIINPGNKARKKLETDFQEKTIPQTIFVDTANLVRGVSDLTPKTGDGIAPKWFLSAGMLSMSAVLFLWKDKNPVIAGTKKRKKR